MFSLTLGIFEIIYPNLDCQIYGTHMHSLTYDFSYIVAICRKSILKHFVNKTKLAVYLDKLHCLLKPLRFKSIFDSLMSASVVCLLYSKNTVSLKNLAIA